MKHHSAFRCISPAWWYDLIGYLFSTYFVFFFFCFVILLHRRIHSFVFHCVRVALMSPLCLNGSSQIRHNDSQWQIMWDRAIFCRLEMQSQFPNGKPKKKNWLPRHVSVWQTTSDEASIHHQLSVLGWLAIVGNQTKRRFTVIPNYNTNRRSVYCCGKVHPIRRVWEHIDQCLHIALIYSSMRC